MTMAYRLKHGEPVGQGIRRIVAEQVDRALGEVADARIERAEVIHRVRKRCKKIRAALRLVRDGLGDAYAHENARYRDAARGISGARDEEAMIETCDALARRFAGREEEPVIQRVCLPLRERRDAFMAQGERIDALLHAFCAALQAGREQVTDLSIHGHGHDVVVSGLRRTYARARRAMHAAERDPKPANFHAWRKYVAYHWRHMQLLHHAWPAGVDARGREAHRLAELLGDLHSLHVLQAWIGSEPSALAGDADIATFLRMADHRARRMRRRALRLGGRLFAERPAHLARRFGIYLDIESGKG
jgi:hypothetical protein